MPYRAVPVVGALLVGGGCVDARQAFDQFGERVVDAPPAIDAAVVSELPDITGDFLMTVRPGLVQNARLYFRVTYTFTPVTENTATLSYVGYPLDYMTFAQVGDAISADMVMVGQDATFDAPLVGTLPGEANSVSGSTLELDGRMLGELRTTDFVCGMLTGSTSGLSLDGTTFGQVRITGTELPEPVASCEDGPPAP